MLTGTLKNWTLKAYTNSTWTDLVAPDAEAGLRMVLIVNTTGSAIAAGLRLADAGGSELAQIVPPQGVDAYESVKVDVDALSLSATSKLQAYAVSSGIHFVASGAM